MAQQTAIEWLINYCERENWSLPSEIEQIAKAMEQQQIKDAVIYGLDEDGHTGDWKIKFVNDYYNKTFKS